MKKNVFQKWKEILNKFLEKGEGEYRHEKRYLMENFSQVRDYLQGIKIFPSSIEIHPTNQCNLKCRWCAGGHRKTKKNYYLEGIRMLQLIDELKEIELREEIKFAGFNGEPLLNPATLQAIIKAQKLGMRTGIFTNGILLNKRAREVLINGKYINISLDAGREVSYGYLKGKEKIFEKVINNISRLVDLKIKFNSPLTITVSYLIHPLNYSELTELIPKLFDIRISALQIKFEKGFEEENKLNSSQIKKLFEIIEEQKRRYDGRLIHYPQKEYFKIIVMENKNEIRKKMKGKSWQPEKIDFEKCYLGMVMPTIGADGNIYPCCHLGYSVLGKIGNIYQGPFRSQWALGFLRLKNKSPKNICTICPPLSRRINQLFYFLETEHKKNPIFLDWLEMELKNIKEKEDELNSKNS